jgi:two-component system, NarL family, invasion response regulator UvrY
MSTVAQNTNNRSAGVSGFGGPRRVLIVDDHPIVRDGLKQVLARAGNIGVAGEADNAEDALAEVRREDWDLVVLDMSLPGRSGLDLLRDLRRVRPALPVLVLSVHPEDELAVRAIRAGASGYLRKDCSATDLVSAIEVILDGRKFISASVAEQLAEEIGGNGDRPLHERLSDRELEVVSLIASGRSAKEIAAALAISKSTVSTYRARILEKLRLHSTAEITRYALRSGLVT